MTALEVLQRVAHETRGGDDAMAKFVVYFIEFGGIDTQELTADEVMKGIHDQDDANWRELWWSANETGYSYASLTREDLDPVTTGAACVCAILMSHAVHRGHGDLEFAFDTLCGIALSCGRRLPPFGLSEELRLCLLRYTIARLPQS